MKKFYEQRLVAFIDILGFKDIVKRSEENETVLSEILEAVSFLKNLEAPDHWGITTIEIEECAQKKELAKFEIRDNLRCTCFSDCIVVSVLLENDNLNEALSTLIANLSLFGAEFIKTGMLIRGGISLGPLIHTLDGTIIGQGMINAYEIENKLAKFPRIVLSKKLLSRLNYPVMMKSQTYPYHQYLKRYEDGCVGFCQLRYFQVLQSWDNYTDERRKKDLTMARKTIVTGLNDNIENPSVYEKYKWLSNEYKALVILDEGIKADILGIQENDIYYRG